MAVEYLTGDVSDVKIKKKNPFLFWCVKCQSVVLWRHVGRYKLPVHSFFLSLWREEAVHFIFGGSPTFCWCGTCYTNYGRVVASTVRKLPKRSAIPFNSYWQAIIGTCIECPTNTRKACFNITPHLSLVNCKEKSARRFTRHTTLLMTRT